VNAPSVTAIVHRQRRVEPTLAVAEKAIAAYGEIFSIEVCAEIAAHPGLKASVFDPVQSKLFSQRNLPAGVVARAHTRFANALTYAHNMTLLAAEDADGDDRQAELPL
jgi:aspartokinase